MGSRAVRPLQAALVLVAFGPILLEWAEYTGSVSRINYSLLVPVLAIALAGTVMRTLAEVPAPTPTERRWGYLSMAMAGILLFLGSLTAIFTVSIAGFPFAVLGLLGIVYGNQGLFRMRYALLMLFAMVPVPLPLLDRLTPYMVKATGAISVMMVKPFDSAASWIGSDLTYNGWTLHVAEACSGSGTLLVLGTLTLFMAGLFRLRLKAMIITMVLIPFITLFINGLRIAVLAWILDGFGVEAVTGVFHEVIGQGVVIAGAVALALAVDRISNRMARKAEKPSGGTS